MAELSKISAKTAAEVCRGYPLEEKIKSLLGDGALSPRAFLDVLVKAGEDTEALRFLAHAIPKREAVFWALHILKPIVTTPVALEAAVLEATHKWVAEPTDPNRRAAFTAAEALGYDNLASLPALAAFLSGGSISGPDLPVVNPAEPMTAETVSKILRLAGLKRDPQKPAEAYAVYLSIGLDIAENRLPCPEPPVPPRG